jgi:hypothetical protein
VQGDDRALSRAVRSSHPCNPGIRRSFDGVTTLPIFEDAMKKMMIALGALLPALSLGACAAGYGRVDYAGGPYSYDGYYDDFYGPIYDGYWGGDGFFYYRGGANEHRFRRGDPGHFRHDAGPGGGGHFHSMQGAFTPQRGMSMPHFGAGRGGGGRRQ